MKTLKIIAVNLLIFFLLALLVEIVFGAWLFQSNNLNNLSILRNVSLEYGVNGLYETDRPAIRYSRDRYGLRSQSAFNQPEQIDLLTIGGSTTDQRYLADGGTWQDALEKKLKEIGRPMKVANAGVDGQSTFGHIKNFELWFPAVPGLRPRYILFYVGINDFYVEDTGLDFDEIARETPTGWWGRVKYKSAWYNLARKIKGTLQAGQNKIGHTRIDFSQTAYTDQPLLDSPAQANLLGRRLGQYKSRLGRLAVLSKALGAQPVFVTQPTRRFRVEADGKVLGNKQVENWNGYSFNGLDYYHILSAMNRQVTDVAATHSVAAIDLTRLPIWEDADFYDFYHMTPAGAQKLGAAIAAQLSSNSQFK